MKGKGTCPTCGFEYQPHWRTSAGNHGKVKASYGPSPYRGSGRFRRPWLIGLTPNETFRTVWGRHYIPAVKGLATGSTLRMNGVSHSFLYCPDPWHAEEAERRAALPEPDPKVEREATIATRRKVRASTPARRKAKARTHRSRQDKDRR